ncbi:uncharacterized protein LOC144346270 [Saccoglossus kowalevskii]
MHLGPSAFLFSTPIELSTSHPNKCGQSSLLAKIDIQHAFRLCSVRKDDWNLLGFKWLGCYFFDRVLPFGLRSAPYLFNQLDEAIHWIITQRANTQNLIHYLDDYLAVAPPPNSQACLHIMNTMLSVCKELGVPIAKEKVEGPSSTLTFLGIELDTVKMVIRLPDDKLNDLLQVLPTWLHKTSSTKQELLSLIGTLSFAYLLVRIFLRRMINLSTSVTNINSIVALTENFRLDVQWWCDFLPSWSGSASFLVSNWSPATKLELFTDASGSTYCSRMPTY